MPIQPPRKQDRRAIFLALSFLAWAHLPSARAEKIHLDIGPGDAAQTLREFASQSRFQILFPQDAVEGKRTPGIEGEFEALEALEHLLAHSGLRIEQLNANTVAIALASTSAGGVYHGPKLRADVLERGSTESAPHPTSAPRTGAQVAVVEEVVVTGSHIRGVSPDSSPVVIYEREEIDRSGAATVQDFMRLVPQNFSSVDSSTAARTNSSGFSQEGSNSYAGSGVNLRGLGPGSTLVLVNGHRLSPAGTRGDFTDVSMIPLSAVERIEVLTDGASATYGAEAIAGVVNFVLRKDFSGAETSIARASATRGGAEELTASQLFGHSWRTGGIVGTFEHYKHDGLFSNERTFVPAKPAPMSLVPEQRRNSIFVTARQDLSDRFSVSADVMGSDRDFVNDNVLGVSVQRAEGTTRQVAANLDLTARIFDTWRMSVTGNYSRSDQSTVAHVIGSSAPPTSLETDTEVTGIDLRADGPVAFPLPSGTKLAMGAGFRTEQLDDASLGRLTGADGLSRDVSSAYVELFLPLTTGEGRTLLKRLEFSLAGRYDHYSDVGSSTNPKFGILWSPITGLNLRGTLADSFRPALLTQSIRFPNYSVSNFQDPAAPDGITTTLINNSLGTADLRPEKSRSMTGGFDFRPASRKTLSITGTYFHIDYTGRIATPPVIAGVSRLFQQPAEHALGLEPFITKSPSLAEVQAIYATGAVRDFVNAGPSGVEAIFDNRLINLAVSEESGVDMSIADSFSLGGGSLAASVAGSYLFHVKYQSLRNVEPADLVNQISQPMDFRLHATLTWTRGSWFSSLRFNYWDDYENNLLGSSARVSSLSTIDLHAGLETGSNVPSLMSNLALSFTVQNVLDKSPPTVLVPSNVAIDMGYDAANASPVGRVVSVRLSKRW